MSESEFGRSEFNEVVFGPDTLTITPATTQLRKRQKQQFKASMPANWSSAPSYGGSTISASGLYTAPPQIKAKTLITVTAVSKSDPGRAAKAMITLTP